jgi:hypothetical protein
LVDDSNSIIHRKGRGNKDGFTRPYSGVAGYLMNRPDLAIAVIGPACQLIQRPAGDALIIIIAKLAVCSASSCTCLQMYNLSRSVIHQSAMHYIGTCPLPLTYPTPIPVPMACGGSGIGVAGADAV